MPAIPLREQLLLNLQTTLQGLSVAGGYFYDVAADAVTVDPTVNLLVGTPTTHASYLQVVTEVGSGRVFQPASRLKDSIRATVLWRQVVEKYDPLARLRAMERTAADLERVLTVDLTRGGRVIDTRLEEPQPFAGIGSEIVIVVQPLVMPTIRVYGEP